MLWTDKQLKQARTIIGKHSALQEALEELSERFGESVTRSSVRHAFLRVGMESPSAYLASVEVKAPHEAQSNKNPKSDDKDDVSKLIQLVKKQALDFEVLCDKLDKSPKRMRELIYEAQARGADIHIAADKVGISPTPEADVPEVQDVKIHPVVGERQKVGVISDTHFGSKYCMREQVKDFVNYAYEQGVREILHNGDCLDGSYRHGWLELTHSGLEDQTADMCDVLPALPGLTYHAITGNHDETFWNESGANVGAAITHYFRESGRNDIKFYGDRSAFLKIRGAVIEQWHPRGGGSYAKSYRLQKHIEGYMAIKPQVLLVGHFHQFCHIFERGVHGLLCPTFQGSGSKFSKSLGGAQAQGGLILSWDLTELGMIRNFNVEKRSYFERERPVEIFNRIDAIEVEPAVYRPTYRK